jgi:hypothetical protein
MQTPALVLSEGSICSIHLHASRSRGRAEKDKINLYASMGRRRWFSQSRRRRRSSPPFATQRRASGKQLPSFKYSAAASSHKFEWNSFKKDRQVQMHCALIYTRVILYCSLVLDLCQQPRHCWVFRYRDCSKLARSLRSSSSLPRFCVAWITLEYKVSMFFFLFNSEKVWIRIVFGCIPSSHCQVRPRMEK